MNPLIKQLVEHEMEGGKLRPQAVMYLKPEYVADADGCRCGVCVFLDKAKSECHLTDPPQCDAEHGVCGLFIGGPSTLTSVTPQQRISKEDAGYVTDAPTHCANCEYFIKEGENGCQKVGGQIYAAGCCSGWEKGGEEEEGEEAEGEEKE